MEIADVYKEHPYLQRSHKPASQFHFPLLSSFFITFPFITFIVELGIYHLWQLKISFHASV